MGVTMLVPRKPCNLMPGKLHFVFGSFQEASFSLFILSFLMLPGLHLHKFDSEQKLRQNSTLMEGHSTKTTLMREDISKPQKNINSQSKYFQPTSTETLFNAIFANWLCQWCVIFFKLSWDKFTNPLPNFSKNAPRDASELTRTPWKHKPKSNELQHSAVGSGQASDNEI